MNKLSKKFIWGITSILCLSCLCSILFNSKFLEAYYLYQKKNALASICDDFINSIGQQASIEEAVKRSEDSDKVIIVRVENDRNTSTDKVNDRIRNAFKEKGVGFQKYWLWEEDYRQIADGKRKVRLYKQDRLNYSLLIEYVQADSGLFAVTMFIPNIGDAFSIINTFLIIVNIAGIVISIILLTLIVRRITKPLEEFKRFASRMKDNEFVPLKVHTKDELEGVADSLNLMGSQIVSYQEALQEKNLQMEHFLDNVAHDLKTPVSLIRLYAAGIKDGLDDGSFLDTIEGESRRMGDMIESLLYVSGIGRKDVKYEEINLTRLLQSLIDGYAILAQANNIKLSTDLDKDIMIESSEELLASLFQNLITNAIKYSAGPYVEIRLQRKELEIVFSIANHTDDNELDISQIWTPYYVGERSRDKKISGTGLGLAIVDKICKRLDYSNDCILSGHRIKFVVSMPIKE